MKILITLILIVLSVNAYAVQTVKWANLPIQVKLAVGKERIIQIEDNVTLGIPSSVQSIVKGESAQGFIYLTAAEEFPKTRFKVRLKSTNEIVLFDVEAVKSDENFENILVNVPSLNASSEPDYGNSAANNNDLTPIQLTRYAARTFYGPDRLAIKDERVRMEKVGNYDLSTLFTGSSYNVFSAEPLAVFRNGKMYLTAIKLTNNTFEPQAINHNHINADFSFSTAQSPLVNQKYVPGDMTMLYLITKKPLSHSLYLTPKQTSNDKKVVSNGKI